MVEYVIKSTISITVLYLLYYILLRNIKAFEFNRFYLLFTFVFSLAIPFVQFSTEINLPITQSIPDYSYTINKITTQTVIVDKQTNTASLNFIDFLTIIYLLVSAILLIRFIFNLYKIIKTIKNSKCVEKTFPIILLSTNNSLPYSFLQYIIVNKSEYDNGNIENDLILHEQTHCKQKHSIDILLIEIIKVVFWFNPIIWILRKEIQVIHEYLADKRVLQTQNLKDYQHILLNLVFRNNSIYLASDFNYSLTKKRLIMMTRNNYLAKSIVRRIAIVPLVLLLAISLTYSQKTIPKDSLGNYENEWWYSILQKHNLELSAFNNFGDIFEMGAENSINDGVSTLSDAVLLIKFDGGYSILKAETMVHDLNKKSIHLKNTNWKKFIDERTNGLPLVDIDSKNIYIKATNKGELKFAYEAPQTGKIIDFDDDAPAPPPPPPTKRN